MRTLSGCGPPVTVPHKSEPSWGSRRTQSSARHIVSSCRPGPPPFATHQGRKSRGPHRSRSRFSKFNAVRFSSSHGHEMGHRHASGQLAILATSISTSAVERQFLAGPIAPSTAPAPTCPEGEANLRLPEFSAHVTPVPSARSAGPLCTSTCRRHTSLSCQHLIHRRAVQLCEGQSVGFLVALDARGCGVGLPCQNVRV